MITRIELATKLNVDAELVRIGFTSSSFDLGPHAGHCVMLREAKQMCDYLIVGLLVNPQLDRPHKNMPVQSVLERFIQVSSNRFVDLVVPFETEQNLIDLILMINPDIRFVGEEYKGLEHTGKDLCPIHYNKRKHSFSSSSLRERVVFAENFLQPKTKNYSDEEM